jgi:hypothetical protein
VKRTPLKRRQGLKQGKPLARGGGLRATGPLAAGEGLKRTRGIAPMSKRKRAERQQEAAKIGAVAVLRAAWIQAVAAAATDRFGQARCALCGLGGNQLTLVDYRGRKFHGHHVIPQQRLERIARQRGVEPETLLWDPRNGMLLCVRCHFDHEHGVRPIPHRVLTHIHLCFARDVGEEVYVERTYPLRPGSRDRPGGPRG